MHFNVYRYVTVIYSINSFWVIIRRHRCKRFRLLRHISP